MNVKGWSDKIMVNYDVTCGRTKKGDGVTSLFCLIISASMHCIQKYLEKKINYFNPKICKRGEIHITKICFYLGFLRIIGK